MLQLRKKKQVGFFFRVFCCCFCFCFLNAFAYVFDLGLPSEFVVDSETL